MLISTFIENNIMNNEFLLEYSQLKAILSNNTHCTFNNPIIVIDDEPSFHEILLKCYEKSGQEYNILSFLSANEAMLYMKGCVERINPTPSLLLVDINLPMINGFDFVKEVKLINELEFEPAIFMLSNSESPKDKEIAKEVGANGYLEKSGSIRTYIEFFKNL